MTKTPNIVPKVELGAGATTNQVLVQATTYTYKIPANETIREADFVAYVEVGGKFVTKRITAPSEQYLGIAHPSQRDQVQEDTEARFRYYKEGQEVTVFKKGQQLAFILSDNIDTFDLETENKVYIDTSNDDANKRGRTITNKASHGGIDNVLIEGAIFQPILKNTDFTAGKRVFIDIL